MNNHIRNLPVPTVLQYLELKLAPPRIGLLDDLLKAWAAHIPWESASRIARHARAAHDNLEDYALWPPEFVERVITQGTGGTCFESNLALYALLTALKFESTLHFWMWNTVAPVIHIRR